MTLIDENRGIGVDFTFLIDGGKVIKTDCEILDKDDFDNS